MGEVDSHSHFAPMTCCSSIQVWVVNNAVPRPVQLVWGGLLLVGGGGGIGLSLDGFSHYLFYQSKSNIDYAIIQDIWPHVPYVSHIELSHIMSVPDL